MTILEEIKYAKKIIEDGSFIDDCLSLEYYMWKVGRHSVYAYFIYDALKSVGIKIDDIEENYNVIVHSYDDIFILCKKTKRGYTFIDFRCTPSTNIVDRIKKTGKMPRFDDVEGEIPRTIKVTKINSINNTVSFSRLDFNELKYYKGFGNLSEESIKAMRKWPDKGYISQNDLFDIRAEDTVYNSGCCAYSSMNQYGEFVSDIDTEKLDGGFTKVRVSDFGRYYKNIEVI